MRCTVIPVRDPVAERIYCILPAFGLGYVNNRGKGSQQSGTERLNGGFRHCRLSIPDR